jgi:hypothetical protein
MVSFSIDQHHSMRARQQPAELASGDNAAHAAAEDEDRFRLTQDESPLARRNRSEHNHLAGPLRPFGQPVQRAAVRHVAQLAVRDAARVEACAADANLTASRRDAAEHHLEEHFDFLALASRQ